MQRIAIQGQTASFHDQAAHQLFSGTFEIIPCDTFAEVFAALEHKKADMAVCAIENSLYGAINEVYDLLHQQNAWICGEKYLPITQNLLGMPGTKLTDIKEVYSHPVALAQCSEFLDGLSNIDRHEHEDTAGAAADVAAWQEPHKAAIASEYAAASYGLRVLAPAVENDRQNYTRFVALSPHKPDTPQSATKTSLILDTRHAPGALAQVLGTFAKHQINLTMLTSRPIIGDPGHYRFYIDLDAGAGASSFKQAEKELNTAGCNLTILGTYMASALPWNA